MPAWVGQYHPALRGRHEADIEALILGNDDLAVEITSSVLNAYLSVRGHRIAALNQYASRAATAIDRERFRAPDDEFREAIGRVDSWLRCERLLLAMSGGRGLPRSKEAPEFHRQEFVLGMVQAMRPLTMTGHRHINPLVVFTILAPPTQPYTEPPL